jgi:hypothetical protein
MKLISWLISILFRHTYFYGKPPDWMKTDKWRSHGGLGYYCPVTKKKCKVCGRTVWSNNSQSICMNLKCWLRS